MHGLRKKPQAGQLLICRDGRTLEVGSLLPSGFASGDILYGSSPSTLSRLPIGAANTVQTSSGTAPQWSSSLTLSGSASFGGTVTAPDGSAATPGVRLTSEAHGLYRVSATSLGLSVAGVSVMSVTGSSMTCSGAAAWTTTLDGAAGNHRTLQATTGGVARWQLRLANNTSESGSDAGSNISLVAYNDAGSSIDTVISITRASGGGITLTRPTTCSNSTASTSTTTGALVVTGGQGIGGQITGGAAILSVSGTAGIGYGTGAGGTVTQITSKSTGVTLNKVCGQITMHNAALAAGARVSFVVTNSACAATDIPDVCVASGGTANAYRADVTAVAAGSFTITVENLTAGSLSEAPVLTFSLGKAVTA